MSQTATGSLDVDVHRVIEDHRAFYEVTPSYVLFEERPPGRSPISRRIQAASMSISSAEERTLRELQEQLGNLGIRRRGGL